METLSNLTTIILKPGVDKPVHGKLNLWDFQAKRKCVQSMIAAKSGKIMTKLQARKLTIIEIDHKEASNFFNLHHLSGHAPAQLVLGLTDGEKLISCASFGVPRFAKADYELIRFCSIAGTIVAGGLSKLISAFMKNRPGASLVSYSDGMLGSGRGYELAGFEFDGFTSKPYFWYKNGEVRSRYQTTKAKLVVQHPELSHLSGHRIMILKGWVKVEGLPHARWVMNKSYVEKKFNYLYKITRFDGAYYYGIHSTDNLEDGYFGSGLRISASVEAHGQNAHVKENLKFFPTRAELLCAEAGIVTKDLLLDEKCLNLAVGGNAARNPFGCVGYKHLNNGVCNIHVPAEEVDFFLANGFSYGAVPGTGPGNGRVWVRDEGVQKRVKPEHITSAMVIGRSHGTTTGRTWVTRNGYQQLVSSVLPGDAVGFTQASTNKGKKFVVVDGKQVAVSLTEAEQMLAAGASKPVGQTTGKIGMRSPEGLKKLVDPGTARQLAKEGWVIANKQLKSAPPQVLELAAELGLKLPKKRT